MVLLCLCTHNSTDQDVQHELACIYHLSMAYIIPIHRQIAQLPFLLSFDGSALMHPLDLDNGYLTCGFPAVSAV